MAANMYRVGDYVFFETSSTTPYQIRRIEELNKTPNGNVEAKVMCFYRRRDISSSLTLLADKHQSSGEGKLRPTDTLTTLDDNKLSMLTATLDDTELEARVDDITDKQKHQLKHRELFLSRQVETLPATHIRGKCVVTLLNETESLLSYLNKEDTFFYSLVYDPSQRTLLADKGEIRVGGRYQADITELLKNAIEEDDRKMEELEELIWDPNSGLNDRQIDQFLIVSRSVGTFARALDCTSTVRQPSLHMSAAAASRDITLFHAMDTLHKARYEIAKAVTSMVPSGGPVLCRDEMEEWSASEANLFEEALDKYGKDFNDIRQDFLPWKSLKSIVEYYYMWKTTDRYVQQKRIKAAEAESKLKQVYIPNYNKPNPAAISGKLNGEDGQVSGRACESCYAGHSSQWYSWGPAHMQCRLCSSCWIYWKKYGGLKMPTRLDGERPAPTQRQERIAQFNMIRMHRCTIAGCGKEFRLKAHLARHLATAHGLVVSAGSPRPVMKTRAAFCLITTSLTRISRRLCRDILRSRRAARSPFTPINIAAIKQECQLRLAEVGNYEPNIEPMKPQTLDPVVARLGINIKMEKPALLLKSDSDHIKPEKLYFPVSLSQPRPVEVKAVEVEPSSMQISGSPSIMKKRGYEQSNGIDGPPSKRPSMGVIRQIGSAMRSHMRGSVLNHNMNGRGKMPVSKGMRMHMINWIDAPDDVYFVATDATRKIRKQWSSQDFKRTARNPWKNMLIKPAMGGAESDIVVLD
ncbi:metastasis-associated protein MTA3-like isoform X2 [Mizuhopecten yessoensis]|uniref:metastasis-associated protein MTA3-like isoform X2 n=1 Tax=Mizuhopecten yessoensis TaxID=6573 RepID=UPI000B459C6A|nr:metastasis-associated protein MTA3-like isoform X2 [Mizuhopecten yessoensis]